MALVLSAAHVVREGSSDAVVYISSESRLLAKLGCSEEREDQLKVSFFQYWGNAYPKQAHYLTLSVP